MSRHRSVQCDGCKENGFQGIRYKCLRCHDYDLCAQCHQTQVTTLNHSSEHPVQCILTQNDYELYYGGEAPEIHSLTCPICGKHGFTVPKLHSHVLLVHKNCDTEVVCPVCSYEGNSHKVSRDFGSHLAAKHFRPPHKLLLELLRESVPSGDVRRGIVSIKDSPSPDLWSYVKEGASGCESGAFPPFPRGGSPSSESSRSNTYSPPPQAEDDDSDDTEAEEQTCDTHHTGSSNIDKFQFLLDKSLDSQRYQGFNPDRSLFLQDLFLSTMGAISLTQKAVGGKGDTEVGKSIED